MGSCPRGSTLACTVCAPSSNLLRLLHVIHSVDPLKGGTTEAVRSLTGHCQTLGHPSTTVTLDSPSSPWREGWNSPVMFAGPGRTHYGWSPRLAVELRAELSNIDLVVIHGLWQHHAPAARRACLAHGVPYVVCPHGMLDPWSLRQHPVKRLLKSVNWSVITRPVLRDAAAICFTTEAEMSAAAPRLRGVGAKQCVVPLGVEGPVLEVTSLAQAWRMRHPELTGRRVALFLGRLHPKKGSDLLIEGFASWSRQNPEAARDLHLRFVGPAHSPQYLAELQALAAREGLRVGEDLLFAGMMTGEAKWQEVAAAEVMILPSHQENFGLVVGEALACSVPVLLSDKVNTSAWVTKAAAGFSAPPSVEGVVDLLTRWAVLDPNQQSAMRLRARTLYESSFSPATAAQTFANTMQDLVP